MVWGLIPLNSEAEAFLSQRLDVGLSSECDSFDITAPLQSFGMAGLLRAQKRCYPPPECLYPRKTHKDRANHFPNLNAQKIYMEFRDYVTGWMESLRVNANQR